MRVRDAGDTSPLVWIFGAVIVTRRSRGFRDGGGLILDADPRPVRRRRAAMVLHGVTQFVSNGWARCCGGAGSSGGSSASTPSARPRRSCCRCSSPMCRTRRRCSSCWARCPCGARLAGPRSSTPHGPPCAVACGFFVAEPSFWPGVAGPLLDVFFVRSALDRRASSPPGRRPSDNHVAKVGYYGAAGGTAMPGPAVFGACPRRPSARRSLGRCSKSSQRTVPPLDAGDRAYGRRRLDPSGCRSSGRALGRRARRHEQFPSPRAPRAARAPAGTTAVSPASAAKAADIRIGWPSVLVIASMRKDNRSPPGRSA